MTEAESTPVTLWTAVISTAAGLRADSGLKALRAKRAAAESIRTSRTSARRARKYPPTIRTRRQTASVSMKWGVILSAASLFAHAGGEMDRAIGSVPIHGRESA